MAKSAFRHCVCIRLRVKLTPFPLMCPVRYLAGVQKKLNSQLLDGSLVSELASKSHGKPSVSKLNNILMQMRKNCNHPDLILSEADDSPDYPPTEQLLSQCGKMQLLDRLLKQLKKRGHKVRLVVCAVIAPLLHPATPAAQPYKWTNRN